MPSLRYFYIISFLLLVIAFMLAGFFSRSYIENNIIEPAAVEGTKAYADKFVNGIWNDRKKTFSYLPCSGSCPNTPKWAPALKKLKDEYGKFTTPSGDSNILSFKLYAHDGTETFDKNRNFINSSPDEIREKQFEAAQNGQITSELIFGHTINGKEYNIVRTFIPIKPSYNRNKKHKDSIIELTYNITPFWSSPAQTQYIITAIIIIVLGVLFGMMFFMTHHAEELLAKEYETNIELSTAMASAEKENKEKSQFLANVSHELRTPLNAIIGFSEIIKDEVMGPLNNQQYKDYINDIYISGVHLLSLINDILDYSKAEAGKLNVDLADVDVTKIMKNSLRLVTPRANEANVHLIGEIPKKHYILHTDGKRLKQVLLNLFSNAVKFTPENGTVTLYAWHNLTENMFVIEVQDTGVGIAAKDISKVMATFGQVENKLSRRYEGTGLGLPLSNKLVELMGGRLNISSEEGKGTTVSVSLPYIEEQGTGTFNEMDALKGHNIHPQTTNQNTIEQNTNITNKKEDKPILTQPTITPIKPPPPPRNNPEIKIPKIEPISKPVEKTEMTSAVPPMNTNLNVDNVKNDSINPMEDKTIENNQENSMFLDSSDINKKQ